MPKPRLVGVNGRGNRIGQDHPHAKLTDRDVELLLEFLDARQDLIGRLHAEGVRMGHGGTEAQFKRTLREAGLSLAKLAVTFNCSKSLVRKIVKAQVRGQHPARFKELVAPRPKGAKAGPIAVRAGGPPYGEDVQLWRYGFARTRAKIRER